MSRKFTLQEVIQVFAAQGCEFLDDFYINSRTPHSYKCNCGRVAKIRVRSFIAGQRCKNCSIEYVASINKLSLVEVQQEFSKQGCEFLDLEYLGIKYIHNYKCTCGSVNKQSLASFREGKNCRYCKDRGVCHNLKYTLVEVKKYFASQNCEFLDDNYINIKTLHNYRCKCGTKSQITFNNFMNGHRCKICGRNRTAQKLKCNIDDVKIIFRNAGCEFLDDCFVNSQTLHNYRCKCGRKTKITFNHFKNGVRCIGCGGKERPTLEDIKQLFLDEGCVFLDDFYLNNRVLHNYQCSCGTVTKICVSNFKQGSRCRICNPGGFDCDKPAYLYLIARPNQFKIGIYNIESNRITEHKRNGWDLLEQRYYEIGREAYAEEQRILDMIESRNIPLGAVAFREPFDGYTEAWNAADLFVESFESLFQKLFGQKPLD
jgi:hypothetical protein